MRDNLFLSLSRNLKAVLLNSKPFSVCFCFSYILTLGVYFKLMVELTHKDKTIFKNQKVLIDLKFALSHVTIEGLLYLNSLSLNV
jgi:hypothetical protein